MPKEIPQELSLTINEKSKCVEKHDGKCTIKKENYSLENRLKLACISNDTLV